MPCYERLHERIDRRRMSGLHERAIEDDRHDSATALPFARDIVEARQGMAGPTEPGPQQRRGLRPVCLAANQARGVAQKIVGIAGAALGEIAPQSPPRLAS